MRFRDENITRNSFRGGNIRQAAIRDAAHDLPGVQSHETEQNGSLLVRHFQAGWSCMALLALFAFRGRVL